MILMDLDKAGAEWVLVAYLSGDQRMLDVIESGRRPHTVTASVMFGVPEDIVSKERKIVGKIQEPNRIAMLRRDIPELHLAKFLPRTMSLDQAGKKSNHGLNYGEGYRMFALINEMDEREAKLIVNAYGQDVYPGVLLWQESIRNELKRDRTLTDMFGNKYRFLDAWGPELFKSAYSFKPQSTNVSMVNRGMRLAFLDELPYMEKAQQLVQVHDSLLMQYPENCWKEQAQFAIRLGLEHMSPLMKHKGREFTVKTDLKIGRFWGEDTMMEVPLTPDVDKLARELEETWEKINDREAAARLDRGLHEVRGEHRESALVPAMGGP